MVNHASLPRSFLITLECISIITVLVVADSCTCGLTRLLLGVTKGCNRGEMVAFAGVARWLVRRADLHSSTRVRVSGGDIRWILHLRSLDCYLSCLLSAKGNPIV